MNPTVVYRINTVTVVLMDAFVVYIVLDVFIMQNIVLY